MTKYMCAQLYVMYHAQSHNLWDVLIVHVDSVIQHRPFPILTNYVANFHHIIFCFLSVFQVDIL
jgi:hypothetical protein